MRFVSLLAVLHFAGCLSLAQAEPSLALKNPGFEQPYSFRTDWRQTQHAGVQGYEMGRDEDVVSEGQYSFRMTQIATQYFGMLSQDIKAPGLEGKTLQYSGMMRSKGVGKKGWMLVVNFLNTGGRILAQARSERLTGDQDWKRVTLEKQAPKGTTRLLVGVMLLDEGTGWLDDVTLGIKGEDEAEAETRAEPVAEAGSPDEEPPENEVDSSNPAGGEDQADETEASSDGVPQGEESGEEDGETTEASTPDPS